MVMLWWPALVVVAVLAVGAWLWARRRRGSADPVWVANSEYLERLPRYRQLRGQYRVWQVLLAALIFAAVVGAGSIAARPMERSVRSDKMGTRDIVLCLDVSTSMLAFDQGIISRYTEMLKEFNGERVGLSIFNSTSTTVFPLTDDYDLVRSQLAHVSTMMDYLNIYASGSTSLTPTERQQLEEFYAPTVGMQFESSLVPDGLASCALLFDSMKTQRSRSIIMATDNQVAGKPIYSWPQATDLVSSRQAALNGLFAKHPKNDLYPSTDKEETEYRSATEATDGRFFDTSDASAVPAIVDEITAQQVVDLDAAPQIVYTDRDTGFVWWTLLMVGALVLAAWRFGL